METNQTPQENTTTKPQVEVKDGILYFKDGQIPLDDIIAVETKTTPSITTLLITIGSLAMASMSADLILLILGILNGIMFIVSLVTADLIVKTRTGIEQKVASGFTSDMEKLKEEIGRYLASAR